MKLRDYLDKSLLLDDLKAVEKADVLAELVQPVAAVEPELDLERAQTALLERESLGTTGIGDGVAIPHGKLEGVNDIILVVGRSREGVDFDALDFKPCSIFFLVLAPEQVAGMHLRILAHVSKLLKDENFRRSFMEAPDKDALWELLAQT